jgi:polyphosphate kinase
MPLSSNHLGLDTQGRALGYANAKMKRKVYEKELHKLQIELCRLQDWVKFKGLRIIILFEGRDAAGKGGTIKALTSRLSPRVFRVVALPAPSDREKTQTFIQRYVECFPAAGEVIIFDRSWYNRAGVDYVMGFCTEREHRRFLQLCPEIEKYIIDGGIQLIKIWLEVGQQEQERRFEARVKDPLRRWKLSPMDLESYRRWYEYSRARDLMLESTDSEHAPWHIVPSNDKRRGTPYLHFPYPDPYSLQECAAKKGQATKAIEQGTIRRP